MLVNKVVYVNPFVQLVRDFHEIRKMSYRPTTSPSSCEGKSRRRREEHESVDTPVCSRRQTWMTSQWRPSTESASCPWQGRRTRRVRRPEAVHPPRRGGCHEVSTAPSDVRLLASVCTYRTRPGAQTGLLCETASGFIYESYSIGWNGTITAIPNNLITTDQWLESTGMSEF
jgi:hypothetical protein